jgi:ubiquinone/menaquinone biosynthesis C-methylase UbiE
MKQTAYYGYPLTDILIRLLIYIIIILIIFEIIFLHISNYIIYLFGFFSILLYSYIGIILFKKTFQNRRMLYVKKMIEVADLKGNETILDIGTGAGILAISFAKLLKDGEVYGIDIYKHKYSSFTELFLNKININFFGNTLKNAQRNAKIESVEDKCKFITADITDKTDFPNNFFDIILSSTSLYCVPIKDYIHTFQTIDKILKKNGKIIFFEPKSFLKWDVNNLKEGFERMGYSIKLFKNVEFKIMCMLVGEKLQSE